MEKKLVRASELNTYLTPTFDQEELEAYEIGGKMVVGYYAKDETAENPLDNMDGFGEMFDLRYGGSPVVADKYCLLWDVYSHSGEVWSLSGEGANDKWDTSKGAAIWSAQDECTKDEVDRRAKVYNHGSIMEVDGKFRAIGFWSETSTDFDTWWEAFEFASKRVEEKPDYPAGLNGHEIALKEISRQALELINQYVSGEVYAACVDLFSKTDRGYEHVKNLNLVGGFYGEDHVKEDINSSLKYHAVSLTRKGTLAKVGEDWFRITGYTSENGGDFVVEDSEKVECIVKFAEVEEFRQKDAPTDADPVFTALCVMEHYMGEDDNFHKLGNQFQEVNGHVALLEWIGHIASRLDTAWDLLSESEKDSNSSCWDFEIVPYLISNYYENTDLFEYPDELKLLNLLKNYVEGNS